MMGRTRFTFRHIFGDWRFWLLLALLFGLFALGLTAGIAREYRRHTFMEKARFAVNPNFAAGYLDLEGEFDSMEAVWAAYVDSPEAAEYYYLAALCNASLAGTLSSILFSFWTVGRSLPGRHASELVLRGAGRGAAFRQLLWPCLGASLVLRWGFFALCFAVMPVHTEYFPPGYFRASVLCWLLLTVSDTAFFACTAFVLPPPAALGADLAAAALGLALPGFLRWLLPVAALTDKALWKQEAFPAFLPAAAGAALAILALSLAAARLAFQRKDLA